MVMFHASLPLCGFLLGLEYLCLVSWANLFLLLFIQAPLCLSVCLSLSLKVSPDSPSFPSQAGLGEFLWASLDLAFLPSLPVSHWIRMACAAGKYLSLQSKWCARAHTHTHTHTHTQPTFPLLLIIELNFLSSSQILISVTLGNIS